MQGRGSKPTVPLSDFDRRRIIGNYETDVHARSAQSTAISLLKTWSEFHFRWYTSGEVPVLPLTPGKIKAVVSQLKEQGYASVGNMISAAKDAHLEDGHPWTEFLAREARRATRSGTRGLGTARQDEEIDVDAAFGLELPDEPIVPNGPCGFGRALEVGSFHILREIELSLIVRSAVSLNLETEEESICLPVSKTDPRANGCTRTWGCVCGGTHLVPCPFHAVLKQIKWLEENFPDEDPDTLPLFPTATGETVEKTAVVESIEIVAGMLGEDLRDQQGRPRFGGHSLRVTGARRLARLAIPTAVIMLMARWSSQVVLRYIRDAPLRGLTQEYRRRANPLGNTATYTLEKVSQEMTPKMRKAIHDAAEGHKYQEERLKELEDRLDKIDVKLCAHPFVQNFASGIFHRADTTDPMQFGIGDCRMTPCGWKYSSANAWTHRELPLDVSGRKICGRCLVSERRARLPFEKVLSSSDSDA